MPEAQKLPYKFEVSMFVKADGEPGVVTHIDEDEPAVKVDGLTYGWYPTCLVVADIDHPGTRGLLLQQYRDASGHEHAVALFRHGVWFVDSDHEDSEDVRTVCGHGESEGAAILDALNRLAASSAAAEATGTDKGCHARVDKLIGHVAVIDARLDNIVAAIARLETRLG